MPTAFQGNHAYQFTYVSVVGGTASVLGGGKFANGATTAAFGYLFNQMMNPRGSSANSEIESREFNRNDWVLVETLNQGTASVYVFGEDTRIALSVSSLVFPPTDQISFTMSWVSVDALGYEPRSVGISNHYATYGSGFIGAGSTANFVIRPLPTPSSPGVLWTIKIPPQAPKHGNTVGQQIEIFRPRR